MSPLWPGSCRLRCNTSLVSCSFCFFGRKAQNFCLLVIVNALEWILSWEHLNIPRFFAVKASVNTVHVIVGGSVIRKDTKTSPAYMCATSQMAGQSKVYVGVKCTYGHVMWLQPSVFSKKREHRGHCLTPACSLNHRSLRRSCSLGSLRIRASVHDMPS